MATVAAVQPPAADKTALKKEIAAIRSKISDAQQDEASWREKLDKQIAILGELRKTYDEQCHAIATGREGDPQAARERVATAEDVIAATKKIISQKRAALDGMFQALSSAQSSLATIEQAEAESNEIAAINGEVEDALAVLAARDDAQEKLNFAIAALRSRSCLTAGNTSLAKNGAARVENLSCGITR